MGAQNSRLDHVVSADLPTIPADAVEAQLQRILASAGFRNSQRRSDLLRWLVSRVLEGDAEPVKEHRIGLEVFGKSESWDPRIDPIVRVECNRVRKKLREYYEVEGSEDSILIEFPTRGYVPVFTRRALVPTAEPETAVEPSGAPASAARYRILVRWPTMAAILAAVALAIGFGNEFLRLARPPLTSLAVLPFLDLSQNHQDTYLSDGFTDELTNALALLRGLNVVARTSAFQFRGKGADVREIGRALNVGTILEGSVLRTGNSIRVVAQLNRTSDGMHLWAATYDREVKDMLRVQDEIAQSIAEALRIELVGGAPPPAFDPGEEAHDQFLHGIYERDKITPESLRKAIAYFESAIRLSPRYARAYGALGSTYLTRAGYGGLEQRGELQKAKKYLEDSLALDPNLGWAEGNLAYINYVLDWDWPSAERRFEHAVGATADPAARIQWGLALMTRGRSAESQEQFRAAIARDPLNLGARVTFAIALVEEAGYKEAEEQLRFCLERSPRFFPAHMTFAYNALAQHQPATALAHLDEANDIVPFSPLVMSARAAAWTESGRRTDAVALLKNMESQGPNSGFVRMHLAVVHALLGDADGTFYWLERSAEAHEQQILYIKVDPHLSRYQSDRRMIALEQRVGLVP